jgi:hypothetical protein
MSSKVKLCLVQVIIAAIIIVLVPVLATGGTLQEEFDQLCIHTQNAESIPLENLKELLKDCEELQKKIETSGDGKKKLLLFRLNKCRNFFAYVIELKEGGKSSPPQ